MRRSCSWKPRALGIEGTAEGTGRKWAVNRPATRVDPDQHRSETVANNQQGQHGAGLSCDQLWPQVAWSWLWPVSKPQSEATSGFMGYVPSGTPSLYRLNLMYRYITGSYPRLNRNRLIGGSTVYTKAQQFLNCRVASMAGVAPNGWWTCLRQICTA